MAKKRPTVALLAAEAGIDVDEALITLWDTGFPQLRGPGDRFNRGDTKRARRALGLATRRERSSEGYWQSTLNIDRNELIALLQTNGVARPHSGGRLTNKAQNRLRAILRERGLREEEVADDDEVQVAQPIEPLVWGPVGHERDIVCISVAEVCSIHETLVGEFASSADPITPTGVKSLPLLESAVFRPMTASGGTRKYPTVEMAAAALLHALVHNHPFHNGNKRTALVAMLVFLDENGFVVTCAEDELFKLVLQLAQHALVDGPRSELADREVLFVARWLRTQVRWEEKGNRPIQWMRLRRILTDHGCTFEQIGGRKITIVREVVREGRGLFGRRRMERLTATLSGVGDGREIDRGATNGVREALELDEHHGIDAAAFYDDAAVSPSEFIRSYHKTLRRLAKL